MKLNVFELYEKAVQSPDHHATWFAKVYKELRGKGEPQRFREDFCGTAATATEWVKTGPKKTAEGWDLDPKPLAYGRAEHIAKLPAAAQSRIKLFQRNVLTPSRNKFDVIAACNFSFFIFRERKTLLRYFKAARQSLAPGGILILEAAGGPGMIEESKERKKFRKNGKPWFTYIWDQVRFDPISRIGDYAIHFRMPNGRRIARAFEYHWRIWVLPELRDALLEAGFRSVEVYWETEHRGEGTGEYVKTRVGDNAYAWMAYVVALR